MKTIYEAKELVDSAIDSQSSGRTLNIFDFDGTIFNSPVPNPILWSSSTISKLMSPYNENGLGWFQNPLTLDPKYTKGLTFNEDVVKEVERSMSDPKAITVLLTGRATSFLPLVKDIVGSRGLRFDEYGLNPKNTQETTMQFKQRFIKELLEKYGDVNRIEMWEDRSKHAIRFKEFIDSMGYVGEVHKISEPDNYIVDPNLERELVADLQKDPRANGNVAESFSGLNKGYYAVLLNESSREDLLDAFSEQIPDGWNPVCHHMTILFSKQRNETVEKFIESNMNKSVTLNAVELGISPDAMAVRIESNVPTNNDIPHITVAIPNGGFAKNSNDIKNWTPLDRKIQLHGVVRHLR